VMATLFAAVAYEIILLNSVPVGDARKKEGSVLFSRQYIATVKAIAVLIILALLMLVPAALLLGVIGWARCCEGPG
jgi:hypothetical protein